MRRLLRPWPAYAAWGLATGVLLIAVAASGYPPFSAGSWSRFDSALYVSIAQDGYDLMPCEDKGWCGNAGWFPAYPWLIRLVHLAGPSVYQSGIFVAWVFCLGTIVLLWATFLERRRTVPALAVLAYAAFAPGQVYEYAIFPLSLLAFATVLHLWLLARGRWLGAGLAGALAVLAYPVGVMLIPAAAIWLPAVRRPRPRQAALAVGPMLAALGLFALDQKLETGRWNAYLLVQDKYGHSLRDPFAPVHDAAYALLHGDAHAPELQTLLVTLVLACALAELAWRRFRVPQADLLVALWAVAAWVFPHAQSNVSVYRSEAALLPLAILLRRLPWQLVVVLALAAAALSVPMARLFLAHQLL